MARIFVDYIPDKIIISELKLYHAYNEAYRSNVPKRDMPARPQPPQRKQPASFPGMALYYLSSTLLSISEMLGMARAQEWLADSAIRNDDYSPEPMSCRIHKAYTLYGLARLARNDVVSAIQSLSYSAKIHPCFHTTRYGLSSKLRNRLADYAEAEDAITLYDTIAWRFKGLKLYMPQGGS